MYRLTDKEAKRPKDGLHTAYGCPFVDDVEDFIFEAILSYVKGLPIVDPLVVRSKRLFDVVDTVKKIGWSVKTHKKTTRNLVPGYIAEIVVQRANVFGKGEALGYGKLNKRSVPSALGNALLNHWNAKIREDAEFQGVNSKRVCILVKSKDRRRFAVLEEDIVEYNEREIEWKWTKEDRVGLQGCRISDGLCVFKWYPSGAQLFERFTLPEDIQIFEVKPRRVEMAKIIRVMNNLLRKNTAS